VFTLIGLLLVFMATSPARAAKLDGLPDYASESSWLLSPPGMASSLAAGLFNPAAFGVAPQPGLYFGWRSNDELPVSPLYQPLLLESNDLAAVVSLPLLSFGYRRFDFEGAASGSPLLQGISADRPTVNEYSLALSGGDRSHALGLSYSWSGGDREAMPRHRRLSAGMIERRRFLSWGLNGDWDVENGDLAGQTDLGIRPFGASWTLFGELSARPDDFDRVGWRGGFGLESQFVPGLRASVRYRDGGTFGLGLALVFGGGTRASSITQLNSDRVVQRVSSIQLGSVIDAPLDLHPGKRSRGSTVELSLKGPMPYRHYRFFDDRQTLLATLSRISAWADDPQVKRLVLNLSGMRISGAMLWELRQQLDGFRARGKTVVVYADRLTLLGTMLASGADEVWLDPQGDLDLRGLSWGRTYYRNALKKLGLGVDAWRYFTYKSAFEVLSRSSQSEADSLQRQVLIDDYYEEARAEICSARGLSPEDFDHIVDTRGYLPAREALALHLVDKVGSYEEAKKGERDKGDSGPAANGREVHFAKAPSIGGVLGDPRFRRAEWGEPAKIAVLYAIGECSMDTGIEGRRLSAAIKQARENPEIKAVVLRVDSPGGDPLPSDMVAREMLETMKVKPVIVSQGNVAASGGYWISMYCNSLLASPLTLTGSIGVIGGWIYDRGFSEKIGFDYSQVQRGAHADMGGGIRLPFLGVTVPHRPLDEEEHHRVEKIIRGMYGDFVAQVAKGRGLSEAHVDSVGQGRVWSGTRGKENGLVDEIGGLWHALQIAKTLAHLPDGRAVELAEGPQLGTFNWDALKPKFLSSPVEEGIAFDPLSGAPRQRLGPWMGLSEEELRFLRAVFREPGRPALRADPIEIRDGGTR
jgi:protease-4